MSTTPNQKDLLAKKSDLEGILKPDDNDVLHLPDVTITLAESGQFYLAGIDKKLLTLVGNTSGNAVTLDGDAGLTFTTSGDSSTITGITSSSGNSTTLAASQSAVSAKQDKIIAGTNIQIAQDGKTISATDTTYSTFNGASASADGSTGLVPKPFIADKDKYLRGDGTWQTIQATPALNDLTDVDLTTPTDGQILKYDAINQEWINTNENPGVTELSGLTDVDVTTTTPTNGQGLVYNSTSEKWENANVLASASVSTLTDVNLTSLKNGQVLKYDTSTQKWINAEDIDETNEFGPSAPTASMGKDGQIYMQYVNPTTITYSTVWTGLALSHYANQPAKVEGFNPSKYYKIRVVGVSYDANVNDEKLVSEIPESSTYSGGWRIGDRMYITTQNNGTELWVYNAPSHPTYPSYITRIEAAQPSEISKVYGKIVNNWIEFPSGSGSSTLTSLSDVNITTPTDGQGLVYNNTTQKWENGTVSSASSIDTLTDVNLTNLTNGQILKYNSTSQEWENANESGGGGGSTVIPNPTGTPTDTLDTVSIDGTIYEIQGSGGGGSTNGFVKLAEYSGSGQGYAAGDTITLSDDMTNYDMLVFATNMFASPNVYGVPAAFVTVDDFKTRYTERFFTWYEDTTGYNDVNYVSDTSIYVLRVSGVSFHAVYGVKFGGSGSGGGAGSGDSFITYTKTVTTTNYGWWTVEDKDGNVLDPDKYIIVDISVTPYYYDVLWSTDSDGGNHYNATLININDVYEIRSSTTYDWTITYAKKDFSGGGGGSTLSDLTDVTVTSPSDGQVLTYDNTSGKWVNDTPTASSSISTLTDVNLTGLLDGQILKYDATNQEWVNADESGGGGSSVTTLFENNGTTSPASITLEDDLTNYDIVLFQLGATNGDAIFTMAYNVADLTVGDTIGAGSATNIFVWYYYTNSTTLTLRVSAGNVYISTIVGIKLSGGSGGGGSTFEGLDYANKISLNIPDATGYTYTPTENGALLLTGYGSASVICESTSELLHLKPYEDTYSTVWILIEKDVTYTIKKGGGSGSSFGSGSVLYFIPLKNSSSGGGDASAEEITLSDYNALTTEEKNDGTIRFIPSENIITENFDMSQGSGYGVQSGMSFSATTTNVTSTYLGGQYIGGDWQFSTPIDVTNLTSIRFNLVTQGCYDHNNTNVEEQTTARFISTVYLYRQLPSGYGIDNEGSAIDMLKFRYTNTDYGVQEFDVSELTGEVYIVWGDHGWTATLSNITLIEGNTPSQIKYMDKTYGISSGEGGGSSEVTYSTTEHKVGTWIDGSDLYEKTINLTGTYQGDSAIDISSYLIGNENIIESAGYLSYVYSGSTYKQPINGHYANLEYRVNKYQLKLSFGSGSSFSMDAYVTIRYTKTSS